MGFRFIKGMLFFLGVLALIFIVGKFALSIFAILIPPFNFVAFIVAFCVGVPVVCHYLYEIYCIHMGVESDCKKSTTLASPSIDVKAREQTEDLDTRMARIEEALVDIKRQNEALTEDYRFLTRVLDKDEE